MLASIFQCCLVKWGIWFGCSRALSFGPYPHHLTTCFLPPGVCRQCIIPLITQSLCSAASSFKTIFMSSTVVCCCWFSCCGRIFCTVVGGVSKICARVCDSLRQCMEPMFHLPFLSNSAVFDLMQSTCAIQTLIKTSFCIGWSHLHLQYLTISHFMTGDRRIRSPILWLSVSVLHSCRVSFIAL